eukprot:m.82100 g.82100  ORF g.82100 m.82100 type:complete len:139 (+) comp14280_c3_seq1:203-619(+)
MQLLHVAALAAVVSLLAIAHLPAGVYGQNICFSVCGGCNADRSACTHGTPYPRNCVEKGQCYDGFQLDFNYLGSHRCNVTLNTYREGCPPDDEEENTPPRLPSATRHLEVVFEAGQAKRCIEFPGLGYTLLESGFCRA